MLVADKTYFVCYVLVDTFHRKGTILSIKWVKSIIHVTIYLDIRSIDKFKHSAIGVVEIEACPISRLLKLLMVKK